MDPYDPFEEESINEETRYEDSRDPGSHNTVTSDRHNINIARDQGIIPLMTSFGQGEQGNYQSSFQQSHNDRFMSQFQTNPYGSLTTQFASSMRGLNAPATVIGTDQQTSSYALNRQLNECRFASTISSNRYVSGPVTATYGSIDAGQQGNLEQSFSNRTVTADQIMFTDPKFMIQARSMSRQCRFASTQPLYPQFSGIGGNAWNMQSSGVSSSSSVNNDFSNRRQFQLMEKFDLPSLSGDGSLAGNLFDKTTRISQYLPVMPPASLHRGPAPVNQSCYNYLASPQSNQSCSYAGSINQGSTTDPTRTVVLNEQDSHNDLFSSMAVASQVGHDLPIPSTEETAVPLEHSIQFNRDPFSTNVSVNVERKDNDDASARIADFDSLIADLMQHADSVTALNGRRITATEESVIIEAPGAAHTIAHTRCEDVRVVSTTSAFCHDSDEDDICETTDAADENTDNISDSITSAAREYTLQTLDVVPTAGQFSNIMDSAMDSCDIKELLPEADDSPTIDIPLPIESNSVFPSKDLDITITVSTLDNVKMLTTCRSLGVSSLSSSSMGLSDAPHVTQSITEHTGRPDLNPVVSSSKVSSVVRTGGSSSDIIQHMYLGPSVDYLVNLDEDDDDDGRLPEKNDKKTSDRDESSFKRPVCSENDRSILFECHNASVTKSKSSDVVTGAGPSVIATPQWQLLKIGSEMSKEEETATRAKTEKLKTMKQRLAEELRCEEMYMKSFEVSDLKSGQIAAPRVILLKQIELDSAAACVAESSSFKSISVAAETLVEVEDSPLAETITKVLAKGATEKPTDKIKFSSSTHKTNEHNLQKVTNCSESRESFSKDIELTNSREDVVVKSGDVSHEVELNKLYDDAARRDIAIDVGRNISNESDHCRSQRESTTSKSSDPLHTLEKDESRKRGNDTSADGEQWRETKRRHGQSELVDYDTDESSSNEHHKEKKDAALYHHQGEIQNCQEKVVRLTEASNEIKKATEREDVSRQLSKHRRIRSHDITEDHEKQERSSQHEREEPQQECCKANKSKVSAEEHRGHSSKHGHDKSTTSHEENKCKERTERNRSNNKDKPSDVREVTKTSKSSKENRMKNTPSRSESESRHMHVRPDEDAVRSVKLATKSTNESRSSDLLKTSSDKEHCSRTPQGKSDRMKVSAAFEDGRRENRKENRGKHNKHSSVSRSRSPHGRDKTTSRIAESFSDKHGTSSTRGEGKREHRSEKHHTSSKLEKQRESKSLEKLRESKSLEKRKKSKSSDKRRQSKSSEKHRSSSKSEKRKKSTSSERQCSSSRRHNSGSPRHDSKTQRRRSRTPVTEILQEIDAEAAARSARGHHRRSPVHSGKKSSQVRLEVVAGRSQSQTSVDLRSSVGRDRTTSEVILIDDGWDSRKKSLGDSPQKKSTLLGACLSTRKEVEIERERRRELRRKKRRERERAARRKEALVAAVNGIICDLVNESDDDAVLMQEEINLTGECISNIAASHDVGTAKESRHKRHAATDTNKEAKSKRHTSGNKGVRDQIEVNTSVQHTAESDVDLLAKGPDDINIDRPIKGKVKTKTRKEKGETKNVENKSKKKSKSLEGSENIEPSRKGSSSRLLVEDNNDDGDDDRGVDTETSLKVKAVDDSLHDTVTRKVKINRLITSTSSQLSANQDCLQISIVNTKAIGKDTLRETNCKEWNNEESATNVDKIDKPTSLNDDTNETGRMPNMRDFKQQNVGAASPFASSGLDATGKPQVTAAVDDDIFLAESSSSHTYLSDIDSVKLKPGNKNSSEKLFSSADHNSITQSAVSISQSATAIEEGIFGDISAKKSSISSDIIGTDNLLNIRASPLVSTPSRASPVLPAAEQTTSIAAARVEFERNWYAQKGPTVTAEDGTIVPVSSAQLQSLSDPLSSAFRSRSAHSVLSTIANTVAASIIAASTSATTLSTRTSPSLVGSFAPLATNSQLPLANGSAHLLPVSTANLLPGPLGPVSLLSSSLGRSLLAQVPVGTNLLGAPLNAVSLLGAGAGSLDVNSTMTIHAIQELLRLMPGAAIMQDISSTSVPAVSPHKISHPPMRQHMHKTSGDRQRSKNHATHHEKLVQKKSAGRSKSHSISHSVGASNSSQILRTESTPVKVDPTRSVVKAGSMPSPACDPRSGARAAGNPGAMPSPEFDPRSAARAAGRLGTMASPEYDPGSAAHAAGKPGGVPSPEYDPRSDESAVGTLPGEDTKVYDPADEEVISLPSDDLECPSPMSSPIARQINESSSKKQSSKADSSRKSRLADETIVDVSRLNGEEIKKLVIKEVQTALKPFFKKKRITKEDYKDVMRKAVPKICHSSTRYYSSRRITIYIEAYVRKIHQMKKYLAKKKHEQLK